MRIVGLTGGIGSGKTTVGKMFTELGVPVYNSDKQAKILMQYSKRIRKAVISLLGEDAYIDKKINRKFIAFKIFNDKNLLRELNGIVHPEVRKHFLSWARKQNTSYVIQEAAVIFENSSVARYDKIILVTAPIKVRIARIVKRDTATEENILARMGSQWKDVEKIPLSDFVIENVDLDKTKSKIVKVHERLLEYSR
ncbi:MAG: dephospho-CoA kinase [Flavobacteriaceae bacterium]